jgi:hypothetical protein
MVLHTIVVEIGDFGTRELRAIGATRDLGFLLRAGPHSAFAAEYGDSPASNAAIANQIFLLELHLGAGKLLHKRFDLLVVFFLRSEIHRACAAIKPAGRNQLFSAAFRRAIGSLVGNGKYLSKAGGGCQRTGNSLYECSS